MKRLLPVMGNRKAKNLKAVLCFVLAAFMIGAVDLPVLAAEARLPISATLIRCVTEAERQQNCIEKSLCCNLLNEEQVRFEDTDLKKRNVADNISWEVTSLPMPSLEK